MWFSGTWVSLAVTPWRRLTGGLTSGPGPLLTLTQTITRELEGKKNYFPILATQRKGLYVLDWLQGIKNFPKHFKIIANAKKRIIIKLQQPMKAMRLSLLSIHLSDWFF